MPRIVDWLILLLAAPLLLPLLAGTALLVRLVLGSPVLFTQKRGGYQGSTFQIFKFRTMSNARDEHGDFLPDERRIGRLGRFLRASSLDELPALLNVLRGEMRLVGPRPFMAEYLPLYTAEQARRHDVRPGLTGWAQVNGRNALSWEEKFRLDTWYVDNRGFWLDVKILFMTVARVLAREGVNAPGAATMHRFEGPTPKDESR
jgi:sugar transferase EpsL